LELSYERLALAQKELSVAEAQAKKLTAHELFTNFFRAVNERDLAEKEDTLLRKALNQLEDEGRHA